MSDLAILNHVSETQQNVMHLLGFCCSVRLGRIEAPALAKMIVRTHGPMDLIEVYIVRLKPLQAIFHRLANAGSAWPGTVSNPLLPATAGDLTCQYDLVTFPGFLSQLPI